MKHVYLQGLFSDYTHKQLFLVWWRVAERLACVEYGFFAEEIHTMQTETAHGSTIKCAARLLWLAGAAWPGDARLTAGVMGV